MTGTEAELQNTATQARQCHQRPAYPEACRDDPSDTIVDPGELVVEVVKNAPNQSSVDVE
jgi:hypothetical protein